jgi:hypothetical protein
VKYEFVHNLGHIFVSGFPAGAIVILAWPYTPPSLRTNESAFTAQHTMRPLKLEHDLPAFSYPLSGGLAVREYVNVSSG